VSLGGAIACRAVRTKRFKGWQKEMLLKRNFVLVVFRHLIPSSQVTLTAKSELKSSGLQFNCHRQQPDAGPLIRCVELILPVLPSAKECSVLCFRRLAPELTDSQINPKFTSFNCKFTFFGREKRRDFSQSRCQGQHVLFMGRKFFSVSQEKSIPIADICCLIVTGEPGTRRAQTPLRQVLERTFHELP
jgi:hypothetical protein